MHVDASTTKGSNSLALERRQVFELTTAEIEAKSDHLRIASATASYSLSLE